MLLRGCVQFIKILQSFDQITTLTYALMDNFCPCLVTEKHALTAAHCFMKNE